MDGVRTGELYISKHYYIVYAEFGTIVCVCIIAYKLQSQYLLTEVLEMVLCPLLYKIMQVKYSFCAVPVFEMHFS